MGEDGGDGEASRALDVHEERAGSGDQGLAVHKMSASARRQVLMKMSYLELVLLSLGSRAGVEEIDGENLEEENRSASQPAGKA